MKRIAIVIALAACGHKSSPPAPGPGTGSGTGSGCELFQPGCDDDALAEAGCYVRCDDSTPCAGGLTCRTVSVMPACAIPGPEGAACDACGEQIQLCLEAPATATECDGPPPSDDAVCLQDCGPPVVRAGDPPPGWSWHTPAEAENRQKYGCPRCLPPDALVATPDGDVAISTLAAGDAVWTLDDSGARVAAKVVLVRSIPVRPDHQMVRVTLDDGRVVTASPEHPLADGRLLTSLRTGDLVGGARVTSAETLHYDGDRTWDLLVTGPTGLYVADGVPMRSTIER